MVIMALFEVICQVCRVRPATSHLFQPQQEAGAAPQELHICRFCQREHHLQLDSKPVDITMFEALLAAMDEQQVSAGSSAPAAEASAATELVCPSCALIWADFLDHNTFGCAACIDAFSTRLEPALRDVHGAVVHVGRVPAAARDQSAGLLGRRLQLERSLQQAVAEEAFERAARIRDELRHLAEEA